jgi:chromosomal replication initiator protein
MDTFSHWIATAESRSAFAAVRGVAAGVRRGRPRSEANPLLLHGPSGSGKTHLVAALAAAVIARRPDLTVTHLPGRTLGESLQTLPETSADLEAARSCDLLIVEDLQHLPATAATAFGRLLDFRCARRRQVVLTSALGPAQLSALPVRLTSRLAAGLVVGLESYGPASRRRLLEELARRRQVSLSPEILDWLAERIGGSGRQLEGAVTRVEALIRLGTLDVAAVAAHFGVEADSSRPTLERISAHVACWFQVELREMRSPSRLRRALLPRQVSMYLARRLTELSLVEIGAFFGGRDHSTVLHAVRKVEQALQDDAALNAAVQRICGELVSLRRAG